MIALRLVRLIEHHSKELAAELVAKFETSSRTLELRKVPVEELRRHIQEILQHFGEWMLTKTSGDIERRYVEIGERRASQGVALSDFCWAVVVGMAAMYSIAREVVLPFLADHLSIDCPARSI